MGEIVPPSDIDGIFDKPGHEWTPEERIRVKVWLHEDPQLNFLLSFALRHLGHGATPEDAEEAWGEFYVKRLDNVIDNYDPGKGRRFWSWLLLCFSRFCRKKGKQIRKKIKREEPLERETEEGEAIRLVLVDENPGSDPEKEAEGEAFLEALNECLEGLRRVSPRQWAVFVLREIEGLSGKETAERLGVPEGSVKGWRYRARLQLKHCLEKKGWVP